MALEFHCGCPQATDREYMAECIERAVLLAEARVWHYCSKVNPEGDFRNAVMYFDVEYRETMQQARRVGRKGKR